MEVIFSTSSSHNNNNNNNKNVNNNSWGQLEHYHRSSSLSLASVANSEDNYSLTDQSFHTCFESEEHLPEVSASLTGRVVSYSCLENVQEEGYHRNNNNNNNNENMDISSASQPTSTSPTRLKSPPPMIVPLRSYYQLQNQQQPQSLRHLTPARLALSSDFGVLKRSLDVDPNRNNSPSKVAHILMERDQVMTCSAMPMSRSFATPRAAVSTAFRSSSTSSSTTTSTTTCTSLDSFTSAGTSMDADATMMLQPPVFLTVESKYHKRPSTGKAAPKVKAVVPPPPLKLEDMADDVQLQILSFVSLADVRCLMGVNRRYRKLLFTRDAQYLWKNWCDDHEWMTLTSDTIVVDDLSLPIAARPKKITGSHNNMGDDEFSNWHQQANLSLLLSMAVSQPTEIDVVQLNEYHTHQQPNTRSRRRRSRHRIHTTDGQRQPLLKYYEHHQHNHQAVVQFTGRVGQGDRCVRANKPFPRPTLIHTGEWMVPPSQLGMHGGTGNGGNSISKIYGGSGSSHKHHGLLDLFCRSTRAVAPPRPAWRPFVAPFLSSTNDVDDDSSSVVHLTPRFVSYYEVSILDPTAADNNNGNSQQRQSSSSATDCVAVGVATEAFDWHTRMPGWDERSFGFHGDDGGLFHASGGMLRKFGPSYGRGDVVGCGIDHVMRGIFFTLNGEFLGYGWTGLPQEILERDLYPVVGIDTNDLIHCNFGNEPFKYDLKSLVIKHEELVHQSLSLASPPVSSSSRSSSVRSAFRSALHEVSV